MAGRLKIKNIDKFQHYGKPNPPWIKFYRDVVTDYHLSQLPSEQRWNMACLWIMASQTNDRTLPDDEDYLNRVLNSTAPIDLDAMIRLGFIERQVHPAETSATHATNGVLPGKTRAATSSLRRQIAVGETMTDKATAYAKRHGLMGEEANEEFANFADYHMGRGTLFADVDAGWRTWVKNKKRYDKRDGVYRRPTDEEVQAMIEKAKQEGVEP